MLENQTKFKELIVKHSIELIYIFGSREKEVHNLVKNKIKYLSNSTSDIDIGVKSSKKLNVNDKVEIAIFFEEYFNAPKVDLLVLSETSTFIALKIVTGYLLYANNLSFEAEYQLYIMKKAAELLDYEKNKQKMILEE